MPMISENECEELVNENKMEPIKTNSIFDLKLQFIHLKY